MNTPTLETERLVLRRFAPEDVPALYEILGDETVNTFLPWFPLRSIREAQAFFDERYAAAYREPRGYQYAICRKGDNTPVGYMSVSMEAGHDLGYGLRREFWRQGLVTEAGRAVVDQVRRNGLPYLTATHDVNNPRSGAVMRRLGMTYRYTYEELWQPKNIPVLFRLYQLNLDGQDTRVFRAYWDRSAVRYVEETV